MKKILLVFFWLICIEGYAQQHLFQQVYQNHPHLPNGILETVAWNNTRMTNINATENHSCSGMPQPYGIMGVFDDSTSYFFQNGKLIAELSGISIEDQKSAVFLQIEAYASAFEQVFLQNNQNPFEQQLYRSFVALSEIPSDNLVNNFALNTQVYGFLSTLNDSQFALLNSFTPYQLNLEEVFGQQNYLVLSAPHVLIESNQIQTLNHTSYSFIQPPTLRAGDYSGAIWNPTPCNFSNRNQSISAITIHNTEGSYAGCISWFKNCNANASAHYVIRSSDGQITQMVEETKKAWHVGSENNYTIGIEHEGYAAQTGWYTEAMYQSSANLVKDICQRRAIESKRLSYFPWSATTRYNQSSIPGSCVKIKGHQHYPNQTHTDPGPNWNWEYYDYLINTIAPVTITSTAQPFFDTGGATGNYANDERRSWLIAPPNASAVSLNFTSFDVENSWDYLYIYDGETTLSPLIGVYTGTVGPGLVTAQSGKMLIVFKSECATVKSGWEAIISVDAVVTPTIHHPATQIDVPDSWKTATFTAHYLDEDYQGGQGIDKGFSHYGYVENNRWTANWQRGFIFDDFNTSTVDTAWHIQSGNWSVSDSQLIQSNESASYSMITRRLPQTISPNYFYHWKGSFSGSSTNKRGGFYVKCSDETAAHGGNSYFVWFRIDQQKVQFYRVNNSVFGSPLVNVDYPFITDSTYDFKWSVQGGKMLLYINDVLIADYEDALPISASPFIAFASNETMMRIDDFMVFRSRADLHDVYVGSDYLSDFKSQSVHPDSFAGRIVSFSRNIEKQLSPIIERNYKVDWTPPSSVVTNDGVGTDVDETYSLTLKGNWLQSVDLNSGIDEYSVAIGTTQGGDDVMGWTTTGLDTVVSHLLLQPIYDQMYFISVRITNGAGLTTTCLSDGQKLMQDSTSVSSVEWETVQLFPNPAHSTITLTNLPESTQITISNLEGKIVHSTHSNQVQNTLDIQSLATGEYVLIIQYKNQLIMKKLIKQ